MVLPTQKRRKELAKWKDREEFSRQLEDDIIHRGQDDLKRVEKKKLLALLKQG